MKNRLLLYFFAIFIFALVIFLYLFDIPAPSEMFTENYTINLK